MIKRAHQSDNLTMPGSGLQLAAEAGTVELRDFRIDTLNGVIDANVSVNGDLAGNVPVFSLGADGTTLTLTPLAAGVLDETLGTMAITPEVVIGLAAPSPITNPHDVTATPGEDTTPFTGGDTLVTLTSAATLASLGIDVAPLGSASLDALDEAPVADFPITGGTAGPGADLVILHQGSGLTLSSHLGSLDLSDFLIDTLNGVVDANVAVNGEAAGNVPVFSLGADGATLTLTPFAAEAVNAVLGTTEITPEVEIGIAAPMPDLLFA